MHTQTINSDTANKRPSFLNVILATVVGSVILFSGFVMSLFLLALSAIILPFAAFKIWLLQKKYKEQINSTQYSSRNVDSENVTVIEGEYIVTENTRDNQ